jgi:hypothetical protein
MPVSLIRSCFACALLMLPMTGCGQNATSTSSGLDGSKKLNDLTSEEKGQFCDWAVNKYGGYGLSCDGDWGFMRYTDRAACIKDASSPTTTPKCTATVSQAEACVNSVPACASFERLKSSLACMDITNC